ncbi:Midasin [Atta colombica]|uniref:Midasin n=1 Tax=Atta colombica TaxID=520822 RepID=A0A151I0E1_9HYME|nr:Midasin [Atta colombica]
MREANDLIFCFNWKKNTAKAHRMLVEVYGDQKKFEDKDLEALLEEDQSQTQEELATTQAVSVRLRTMGMIQKLGNWVPYELKPRNFERRFFTCEQLIEVEHNSTNPFPPEDKTCEELFLQSIKCNSDGRFIHQCRKFTKGYVHLDHMREMIIHTMPSLLHLISHTMLSIARLLDDLITGSEIYQKKLHQSKREIITLLRKGKFELEEKYFMRIFLIFDPLGLLNPVTLFELCTLLLAQLINKISKCQVASIYLWTNSTIVLTAIMQSILVNFMAYHRENICKKDHPTNYKKFHLHEGTSSNLYLNKQQHAILIKVIQLKHFVKRKQSHSSYSPILKLNPFLDDSGILCVSGHLRESFLSYAFKHHTGQQATPAAVHERYWLILVDNTIRHILRKCICFRTINIILYSKEGANKNFVARRNCPLDIFSDNDVGAKRELNELAEDYIWEAVVKATKRHLTSLIPGHFLTLIKLSKLKPDTILEILCEFLMQPECTKDVIDCFPELLLGLISVAIPIEDIQSSALIDKNIIHRLNCVILGKLLDVNQDLLIYVLHYFDINPAPFEFFDESFDVVIPLKKRRKFSYISEVSECDIVIACYSILQSAVNHFKHKWNWSRFYKYLTNADDRIKWVALKCIAIVLNMSESTRLSCAQTLIPNFKQFLIDYEDRSINTNIICAGFESMEDIVKNISSIVSVGGILLPTLSRNSSQNTYNLVPVSSTKKNLQSLAIAIGSRKCICLQGPVGCGKTALVEYLARVTGHDTSNFIKMQLGDQTDSKMLLGMYRCTDVPGEFVWQPGVLTQAVIAGKWLLLEDVDSTALDVASILSNLMETGTLCVPGYRDTIYVNSGFQLFVTQRLMTSITGIQKYVTGSSNLLQKHWLCLNVEPLSTDELVTLVQTLFPVLNTIAIKIIDVFLLFSVGDHDSESNTYDAIVSLKIGRQTSTRDLIKWCSRAIVDFNVSSSDSLLKIFQDALDVFCCSVPNQEQRLNLAKAIARKLGIIMLKAEYFCNMYKPSIDLLPEFLIAGRAKLTRKKAQYARIDIEKIHFSFTRPSACLLERIAICIKQKEPVLLVGETGTGKTSSIQYLARSIGHKLIVINMNQQSESADLLGGYKPVDLKFLISPIREEFEILFRSYFMIESNKKFLEHIALCHKQQKWKNLIILMSHSAHAAVKRLRNKYDIQADLNMLKKWEKMLEKLNKLGTQVKSQYALAFSFIEGSLVRALRDGYWVLLDEINLANAETLECLSGLLEGSSESLSLLERGDGEPVKRHPDFTVFACMNPATDVGKRDLPVGLRNRFTEFYVDELTEQSDLELLVNSYLAELNLPEKHKAIVKFYLNVRKEAMSTLFDGTAHKPHYSLRTLCRALYISASNPCGNVLRSLYESFSLSFLTQLDYNSYPIVQRMIAKAILDNKNIKEILGIPIPKPKCSPGEDYIYIEGYWILQGSLMPETPSNYILTDSVRRNLKDLVRVVSIGKIPVLLQGDTSVGKTSLITYLAKITGHVCVRINNHEHTDLQEYVGSYIADETGKLVFKEGILVDAMRKGYWIILDELNLAPSDVLEALNRVLDDNRELFIPETQQVVKAHEHFMLFATQNPPGLYGGRKVLSRAFRNRFIELHFDEIPPNELQIILNQRCCMPESYCKQVINVMTDLQTRRKSTATFAGKKGFITLRDLFRWGERYRLAPDIGNKLYDWSQHLADEGYLVLAAKVRKVEEADEIRQVIRKHLKKDVDPDNLFTLNDKTSPVTRHILEEILKNNISDFGHIVWTYHMRRIAVLMKKSCQFKEPVLLVGETGGGKTTVCQLIAVINGQAMRSVNCHMHTESSDFLGNLRPVRDHVEDDQKLFEWVDGPLINAMRNGDLFLADEISLADDSVLERLNSLLEPERSLLLAEKGIESLHGEGNTVIVADEKFIFVGTMNPGGDYGKKELSPALRNRFTEVWCEGCMARSDLRDIIIHNLCIDLQTREFIANAILKFTEWLQTTEVGKKFTVSIRDVLTWVNFINVSTDGTLLSKLTIEEAYYHGACLTYIDSLGSNSTGSESISKLKDFTEAALRFIKSEIENTMKSELNMEVPVINENIIVDASDIFGILPFYIKKGPYIFYENYTFTFTTPTAKLNTLKLLRALQLNKPILLEGSPGVGKTSLVSALAKATGHTLLRINLSDQTDVSDLFGADLPVEGGKGGEFAWRDGPFLRALRAGYWILLDELNLASQSVLEGLNACFDHRGEIYVPELGKTFSVKPGTRLFGCQNPLRQGGARRGLPRSFLNRFTQISVAALMEDDLKFILSVQFPQLPIELINHMVQFNNKLASEAGIVWGHTGSPWEMNLRDIIRWCETTIEAASNEFRDNKQYFNPGDSVELIYVNRMRTNEDRQKVYQIYQEMFSSEKYPLPPNQLPMHITTDKFVIGEVMLSRKNCSEPQDFNLLILRDQKRTLKSLMQCVKMNWMSILVGTSGSGKSSVVRLLAALTGQKLRSITVNSAMDTTEILGGFEQTDYNRHLEQLFEHVATLLIESLQTKITIDKLEQVTELHEHLEQVRHLFDENVAGRTMVIETKLFLHKIEKLLKLISAMKLWEPSRESQLQNIESRLRNLSIFVEEDKCLNAGGKFEWVDSVLVKCLQDGTWLLIDQVNLCSSAVLDRLNGLLEPNGVLCIGERGIDSNGNVVTIKPHENFRLFLTMNSRYGEISRAMRNRGVEIYMLDSKENVDKNVIDFNSLLFNTGIIKSTHRDALLEIYDRMSEEIAWDQFNVVDLLHTAFLVKQRLLRGFSVEQSIRNACIDVYIKPRPRDSRFREHLTSLIDETVKRRVTCDEEISVIDLNAATWSVRNLQDNSRLVIIRQQSLLLNAAVKIYESSLKSDSRNIITTKSLNNFCGLKKDEKFTLDVDVVNILPYLLLNFYEQSSRDDASLRKEFISKMLRGKAIFNDLEHKSALMAKVIALYCFESTNARSSLSWDLWQLIGRITSDNDDNTCRDTNKLLLLLYAYNMILKKDMSPKKMENKDLISIKLYSSVVNEGKLFSQLKNQPLIMYFVQFLEQTRSCINAILQDININIKEYIDLRKELKWFTRFETLGEFTLIDKTKKSKDVFMNLDRISVLLRVHYKWLLKLLRNLTSLKCHVGGPVLLNLVLQLMLNKTNQEKEKNVLPAIALGTYTAQINQLQLLNEILWRNSISLTNKQCNSNNNDLATLKFYLHLYSSTIHKMDMEHDIKKQVKNCADDIKSSDYFKSVEELHEAYNEINIIDDENEEESFSKTLQRGKGWMILGYIQLMLFGNLDLIDPVHKVELKLQYLEEDINDFRKTIYVTMLQDRILGISAANEHPRFAEMRNCEKRLLKMRDDLNCLRAFRPASVNFASLSKDSADFRNRVGSYTLVKKHINNLYMIADEISRDCELTDLTNAETISREAEIWGLSVQRFAEQIRTKYLSAYPDVILPLLTALAQLNHGVFILINEIRRLISLRKNGEADLESLIYNLIRFPTVGLQQENLLNLSDLCVSTNMRSLVGKNSCSTDTFVRMQEQFRIFKSGLYELHNHVILNKGLTKSLWRDMNKLLQQIVLIWKQQQLEEEKRTVERDSLYKNKIESHNDTLTEEEEIALEIRKLFPSYREKDFNDIEDESQPSLNEKSISTQLDETESNFSGLITKDDIREIQQIHSNIVKSFMATKWICNNSALTNSTNYIGSLIQRYNTIYGMLNNILSSLSEGLAVKLYNSLNFLVTLGLQASQEKSSDRTLRENTWSEGRMRAYDFYKDCNVEEVKQCLPLCENILNHVDNLLKEWPEHPTLRSIRCIIERIYTFSVTSPISRFLTGLELLLVKMHQWEENAHSGVSMTDHVLKLTQQIIYWRKLELSCWKGCLDATYENLRSDTSKWWFFLYALIESYVTKSEKDNVQETNDEPITKQKFIESLEHFMNQSSLVEFESCLDLLLTFHCHVYYFDDSDNKNELLAILWNVYNYYKQFVDNVNARIAVLKAPIEKKLKDFVKIARWNDISYWAVKETVEKTHRTLHKLVKEFQNALKQAVPEDFIITKSSQSVDVKVQFTSELITLLTKARKAPCLCKEIILVNSYPNVRKEFENFIENYMEQSVRLREINIDRSLPKNKQKSQAKSILQQKKMTLANYFKELTQMGISYRTGILTLKNNVDKVIDFTISPLDLSTIGQYFKLKKADQNMLTQWKGCEKYYYKSLIRLNALNAMLSTNQTDLGLQNIERCRGYSAHLMLIAHMQKMTIVQSFDRFSSLRAQILNLSETREQDLNMLRQNKSNSSNDSFMKRVENLKTLLITLEVGFEQLLLFLQCCPVESSSNPNRAKLTLDANALPIITASQNDEIWKNANAMLKDSLNSVKATAKRFHTLFMPFEVLSVDHFEQSTHISFASSKHFEFLEQCYIENEEQLKKGNYIIERYESDLKHLINIILLVIQKKFKDIKEDMLHMNKKPNEENINIQKEAEEKLKLVKLVELLERDIKNELKLADIYNLFSNLLLLIRKFDDPQSANHCIRLLLKCLPLLEQYILFVQFYLNEQVASFRITCKILYLQLNVFLDLAANGFCVPKDLDLEESEMNESEEKTEKGGMGLVEGEGTKDVSDRIESEDQLEDAKPADQEREKQDDKTCKEEEKGIDISEDFDSKLQDMEKNDNDEEQSNDDEENDLDKEMGEIEESAEQLDKEIWGDDQEESETDNQQSENEEEGTGEQIGEKEMSARDDNGKRKQDDDDNTNHDENRQEENKKEINELNEPEVDEDHINPYHGKFQPQPEPEPLDLPEDINLDENGKEDNGGEDENPFDIDEMKKPPLEKDLELKKESEEIKENDPEENSSQSQSAQQESGHSGSSKQETVSSPQNNTMTKPVEKRKNLGESNEDRSLLDRFESTLKKLKTTYTQDEVSIDKKDDTSNADDNKVEMAQHIKDSEKFDDYTLDAATEDQIKQQASNMDKDKNEEEKKDDIMDVEMHEDKENDVTHDKINEHKPEKVSEIADNQSKKDSDGKRNMENNQIETTVELEGETAETMKVERGNESTFHTMEWNTEENNLYSDYVERKRYEMERMLDEWTQVPSTEEATAAWNCLCSVTDAAARDLSEKLRLVLEPTQASRLKGDYKTGKRINMRKIIPYIASQFRKDKIWLRRTKPSKRDYQIVLALDDSSSMADNHSKELAFESLSLISKAMTYLEVGQLSVISFGEQVKVLHPLGEAFTEQSGSRLIQEMRFDQKKTMIGQLVDFTVDMFESQCVSSDNAKLLVVLSDGRGIFSEGKEKVNCAVRRARLVDIFLVFIIVDNPINKDSILDIRMPIFEKGKLLGIRSYMDNFPFPFYMILRDINTLPGVLSDALRQWFEVVGKN